MVLQRLKVVEYIHYITIQETAAGKYHKHKDDHDLCYVIISMRYGETLHNVIVMNSYISMNN